jgi:hypothetical protein
MKEKKTLKNTLNSQVYNKALRQSLGCPICAPNKGCNQNRDNNYRNWKQWRKTKWK